MNEISWMLYAAEVSGRLSKLLGASAFASALVVCGYTVYMACEYGDVTKVTKILTPIIAAMAVVSTLLPSSSTIYAIAASEMGEEVLQSPTASKAMKALDKWLDEQLDDGGK